MDHITLNGKSSLLVKGLMILSLPPITKPLMRAEKQEIDGRAGDLITELGYAAYDKDVSIGLRGDFKVDDVIDFFASSGTVIFSNEPDKYYNYSILDQIDFAKLLRFRTATVRFHVQPYKYSAVERAIAPFYKIVTGNNTRTADGVTYTITATGMGSISGTKGSSTAPSLDVTDITLEPGMYYAVLWGSGTIPANTKVELHAANQQTQPFGFMPLWDNTSYSTARRTLTDETTFDYLVFDVPNGGSIDAQYNMWLESAGVYVTNSGNTTAFPKLTLTLGENTTTTITLDGSEVLTIAHTENTQETLVIDTEAMEATINGALANRMVTGDYQALALTPGTHQIRWSAATVYAAEVTNYSRWI